MDGATVKSLTYSEAQSIRLAGRSEPASQKAGSAV